MTWQPIDTAPKDGTPFLINSEEIPGFARAVIAPKFEGEYYYSTPWANGWTNYLSSVATHWMPIPKGPEVE